MNLQLLPREIQILINEYNVDHRPKMKMVLEELLERFVEYIEYNDNDENICFNCGAEALPEYTVTIFCKELKFCGSWWCRDDTEYYARKNYYINP